MKEVLLHTDIRFLTRAFPPPSQMLSYRGEHLPAGEKVAVSDAVMMTYDHRDQLAVPCAWGGHEGFLLHNELMLALEPIAAATD